MQLARGLKALNMAGTCHAMPCQPQGLRDLAVACIYVWQCQAVESGQAGKRLDICCDNRQRHVPIWVLLCVLVTYKYSSCGSERVCALCSVCYCFVPQYTVQHTWRRWC